MVIAGNRVCLPVGARFILEPDRQQPCANFAGVIKVDTLLLLGSLDPGQDPPCQFRVFCLLGTA